VVINTEPTSFLPEFDQPSPFYVKRTIMLKLKILILWYVKLRGKNDRFRRFERTLNTLLNELIIF
jgi:hypothetical protein